MAVHHHRHHHHHHHCHYHPPPTPQRRRRRRRRRQSHSVRLGRRRAQPGNPLTSRRSRVPRLAITAVAPNSPGSPDTQRCRASFFWRRLLQGDRQHSHSTARDSPNAECCIFLSPPLYLSLSLHARGLGAPSEESAAAVAGRLGSFLAKLSPASSRSEAVRADPAAVMRSNALLPYLSWERWARHTPRY